MVTKQPKPAWWVLYALLVLMLLVLAFEGTDGLPDWANEAAGIGIVLLFFAGMALWVRLNAAGLWNEELRNIDPREFEIVEYLPQSQMGRSNGHGNSPTVSVDESDYSMKDQNVF